MHAQLTAVVEEFESALRRLHALRHMVPPEAWSRRPDPDRWSAGECVAHLNLTSSAYVPLLRGGLAEARRVGGAAPTRYRRDVAGWLLWKGSGPPVRLKIETTAPFVPRGGQPMAELVSEFERLQEAQIACVRMVGSLRDPTASAGWAVRFLADRPPACRFTA